MDANKLVKLRVIQYTIDACCGTCLHGEFVTPATRWGTCAVHQYEHQKHTGEPRDLSVHEYGHCHEHVHDDTKNNFQGFDEFVSDE